jgi:hypothetical protein
MAAPTVTDRFSFSVSRIPTTTTPERKWLNPSANLPAAHSADKNRPFSRGEAVFMIALKDLVPRIGVTILSGADDGATDQHFLRADERAAR